VPLSTAAAGPSPINKAKKPNGNTFIAAPGSATVFLLRNWSSSMTGKQDDRVVPKSYKKCFTNNLDRG
jgi:hypothetical protein